MSNNEKRGKFLKQLRKEKNITQEELSKEINYSSKVISSWEQGTRFPNDIDTLKNISDYFNITYEELIKGERNTTETSSIMEQTIKSKYQKEYSNYKKKYLFIIIFLIIIISILLLIYFIYIRNTIKLYSLYYYDDTTPYYVLMTRNDKIQDLLYFKAINNNNIIKLTSDLKEEISADIKVIVSILS